MKTIFDAKKVDLNGLFIIKETASKPFKDIDFARTVTFKICYSHKTNGYSLCNILTDGMIVGHYANKDELVKRLNEDENGYRPLTKQEFLEMLEHTQQGFY